MRSIYLIQCDYSYLVFVITFVCFVSTYILICYDQFILQSKSQNQDEDNDSTLSLFGYKTIA